MHLPLLDIAELLDHSGLEVGDSVNCPLTVGVDCPVQRVGLIESSNLVIVALRGDEKLVIAAALTELTCEACVTALDRIDNLLTSQAELCADCLDCSLYGVDSEFHAVDVRVESGSEKPYIGIRSVDSIEDKVGVAVGGCLRSERSGCRTATASEAEAVTKSSVTEKSAEDEAENTSAPASKSVAPTAVLHSEPSWDTSAVVTVRRVNYC